MIDFKVENREGFIFIEVTIDGVIEPVDIQGLNVPHVDYGKPVVIGGRAPIWLYGYLIHKYHYAPWVATFGPRLKGAVVVASHSKDRLEGEVIPMTEV